MASLPGAVMKKSSGYGSALSLARAISSSLFRRPAIWARFPGTAGSSSPTLLGWVVQFLLLCFFFALNYYSVKTFARSNNFKRAQVSGAAAGG